MTSLSLRHSTWAVALIWSSTVPTALALHCGSWRGPRRGCRNRRILRYPGRARYSCGRPSTRNDPSSPLFADTRAFCARLQNLAPEVALAGLTLWWQFTASTSAANGLAMICRAAAMGHHHVAVRRA